MKAFTGITLSYKPLNDILYPKIVVKNLITITDFNPVTDYFTLHKYKIEKNNIDQIQLANDIISIQAVPSSLSPNMSDVLYMSEESFLSFFNLVDESQDISAFIAEGKYNIIDLNTDPSQYLYIYSISGYYNNEVYKTDYVLILDVVTEAIKIDIPSLPKLTAGIGNIYNIDYRKKIPHIFIKGIPNLLSTARYKGPIDHTKEQSNRDTIIANLQLIEKIYNDIDNKILSAISLLNTTSESILSSYRRSL